MGLSREQRVERACDLFLFRMEITYETWADGECALRIREGGRLPSEDELWGEYERRMEEAWPEYRDYCLRTYTDEELDAYVDAYRYVAQERMRREEYEDRKGPPAPDFEEVLARYARSAAPDPPANDNKGERTQKFLPVEAAPPEEGQGFSKVSAAKPLPFGDRPRPESLPAGARPRRRQRQ
jgi:hypothetical protein